MNRPCTSWPASSRRRAATDESTPPDMPTIMRPAVMTPASDVQLANLARVLADLPHLVELREVDARHARFPRIHDAFPAIGAGPVDQCVVVGDQERVAAILERFRQVTKLDERRQSPADVEKPVDGVLDAAGVTDEDPDARVAARQDEALDR